MALFRKNKKSNYLIILHNFFVSSNGFETIPMFALTNDEVEIKAKAMRSDRIKTGNDCSYIIIDLEKYK